MMGFLILTVDLQNENRPVPRCCQVLIRQGQLQVSTSQCDQEKETRAKPHDYPQRIEAARFCTAYVILCLSNSKVLLIDTRMQ